MSQQLLLVTSEKVRKISKAFPTIIQEAPRLQFLKNIES